MEFSRREYKLQALNESHLQKDPIVQFKIWFEEVQQAQILEPNAMALATASASGAPSCRTVLLKGIDPKGFVFFTNYESQKAQELEQNPQACLLFFWKELERQVSIKGHVEKVTQEESSRYFAKRPRGSQLSVWASRQSQIIASRSALEEAYQFFEKKYEGQPIPLPPYWGGYRLFPTSFEFWQGRENRLHDRFRYILEQDGWRLERLAP